MDENENIHLNISFGLQELGFKCRYCDKVYGKSDERKKHEAKRHLSSNNSIASTVLTVRSMRTNNPLQHQCVCCLRSFESGQSLKNHVLSKNPRIESDLQNLTLKNVELADEIIMLQQMQPYDIYQNPILPELPADMDDDDEDDEADPETIASTPASEEAQAEQRNTENINQECDIPIKTLNEAMPLESKAITLSSNLRAFSARIAPWLRTTVLVAIICLFIAISLNSSISLGSEDLDVDVSQSLVVLEAESSRPEDLSCHCPENRPLLSNFPLFIINPF